MIDERGYEYKEPEVYHNVTASSDNSSKWYAPGQVARLTLNNGGIVDLFSPTMDFGSDHLSIRGWSSMLVDATPPKSARTSMVNSMQHWILKVNMTKEELDAYAEYMSKKYPDWKRDWRAG